MKASLLALRQGLNQLKHHLQGLELEAKLLAAPLQSALPADTEKALRDFVSHRASTTTRRRFEYTSLIVTLYGLFEQYIEGLMRGYLSHISSFIPAYPELPETIRKNHVPFTTDLFGRLEHQKYRNTLTVESLIDNLHSCQTPARDYKLNIEAFCHHNANFKADTIESFFLNAGIRGVSARIREHKDFDSHYTSIHRTQPSANASPSALFAPIDDLAERRNEIAHGSPAALLSNELVAELIAFVEAYSSALHYTIKQAALPFEAQHLGRPLGPPLKVFNNSIVCIDIANIPITTGDWLIAKPAREGAPFLDGEIVEIQINSVSHKAIHPATQTSVALRVDFSAKKNQEFFLVPRSKKAQ